jgi:nucleotide-binding universal stress UspA family protein
MEVLVLIIGVTWMAIGGALGVLMGRRGFDAYGWFVLGVVLGPLALILAVYVVLTEEPAEPEVLVEPPRLGGPVDVIVGSDGSPESRAALRAAIDLFGPRLGRLTLARAVPHNVGWELERSARAELRADADALPQEIGLQVVHGRPDIALTELARTAQYDVIAIGTRGSGLTKQVLGSVAVQLARQSAFPVLLVGGNEAAAASSPLVAAEEAS